MRRVAPPARRAQPVVRRLRAPTPTERANRLAFGTRIRDLRLERGLSQERLAEAADLHRNHLGTVERGEQNPTLDSIMALATALDVPPAALFEGWPEGEPESG